jgi:hypothetical protein
MFASLAADSAIAMLYDRDLADSEERIKYMYSILRRAEEPVSAQNQYEAEQAARNGRCVTKVRSASALRRSRCAIVSLTPFYTTLTPDSPRFCLTA